MQIIENWSDIKGIVQSLQPSPNVSGFMEVELHLEKVNSVEGFANLLEHADGKSLIVLIPEELVRSLNITSSDTIECRIRRAGPNRSFVHRNHISVRRSR